MYRCYVPYFTNGILAPLPWQAKLMKFCGYWPIADDATWRTHVIVYLLIINLFVSWCFVIEAECNFFIKNHGNLSLQLECIIGILTLTEIFMRACYVTYSRTHFRQLLSDFYTKVYIEQNMEPNLFKKIQLLHFPTKFCGGFYALTAISFLSVPIVGLFYGQRLLPYKMLPHFDYEPLHLHLITLYFSAHLIFCVICHMICDYHMLALFILHLNGQYQRLQDDLEKLYLFKSQTKSETYFFQFQNRLIAILRRNQDLNNFAEKLKNHYSVTIFILMGFSAIVLCALGFTTMTTNQMDTAYYFCHWEEVILLSPNAKENAELMKLIAIAINLNQKPISLNGFFFTVSLETVVKVF
ncbi:odorant receptor 74a-like [Teleopsis dalmanni]|uniref:odorant receptor 74a-like n=1 Tax=Teleopsis dalmanni TaxID=139649 RepID=UPI0018CD9442|nr:odorant receptor 74a-like [Teleopsis dalmanni]